MKSIRRDDVGAWLASLEPAHEVYAPIQSGPVRVLDRLSAGALALGGQLPLSPVRLFLPEVEPLLEYGPDGVRALHVEPAKPKFVFGCSAADAKAIAFTTRFYEADFGDTNFAARRSGALVGVCAGHVGAELEPLADAGYDVQVVWPAAGDCLVQSGSPAGEALMAASKAHLREAGPEAAGVWAALARESAALAPKADLDAAARLLAAGKVDKAFWESVGLRCISCGGCTYVCPTCTCFDVYDRGDRTSGRRLRTRDSCLLPGFTREASRHNPRGTDAARSQRRVEHKLAYDPKRWGELGCVRCGRCDVTCPAGIGLYAVVNEMVAKFGAGVGDAGDR